MVAKDESVVQRRETQQAVAEVRETPDTWRVYLSEWIIKASEEEREKIEQIFAEKYEGRVREDDMRIVRFGSLWVLELFLPNVIGEFKHRELAEEYVAHGFADKDVTLVSRNSKPDQDLRNYGVLKLPDEKASDRPEAT